MKRILVILGLALVLAVCALPTVAQSPNNIWSFTNQNAYASFYAADPNDPSGCTSVQAVVSVNMNDFNMPGSPSKPSASMSVFLAQADNCAGVWLKFFQDSPAVAEFTVSESTSSLKAQGQIWDQISNSLQWVMIDLTWSPTALPTKSSSTSHYKTPQVIALFLNTQMYRPADVTGNISVEGANFTPEKSRDGNFGMNSQKNLGVSK
jgi:hypothetical protein